VKWIRKSQVADTFLTQKAKNNHVTLALLTPYNFTHYFNGPLHLFCFCTQKNLFDCRTFFNQLLVMNYKPYYLFILSLTFELDKELKETTFFHWDLVQGNINLSNSKVYSKLMHKWEDFLTACYAYSQSRKICTKIQNSRSRSFLCSQCFWWYLA